MLKRGFVRARVDGQIVRLTEDLKLDRRMKHDVAIVVDRLKNEPKIRPRLAEAVEQALGMGDGSLIIAVEQTDPAEGRSRSADGPSVYEDILLSAHYACTFCDRSYEPPSPQMFSFNSPQGMCPDCDGLGYRYSFDPELLIPDPALSFFDGAIPLVGRLRGMGRWRRHTFEGVAQTPGIDLQTPWRDLPREHQDLDRKSVV